MEFTKTEFTKMESTNIEVPNIQASKMKTLKYWLKLILNVLFSVGVIAWAAWSLEWEKVWAALSQANVIWVIVAISLIFLTFLTRTIRWQALLWPQTFSLRHLFSALLVGQALNYIAPVRAGDFVRAYMLGEAGDASKTMVFTTVVIEKFWEIVMLLLFTLIVSWFFPLPPWLLTPARSLIVVAVIFGLGLVLVLWQQKRALLYLTQFSQWLAPSLHERLLGFSQSVLDGFSALQHPRPILTISFWSFLTWVISAAINYVIFLALDMPLGIIPALLLMVVLRIGVALPALPASIGVFEGLCVFVLALFGVAYDIAFSYGLLLHLVVFVPPILVAAIISLQANLSIKDMTSVTNYAESPTKPD